MFKKFLEISNNYENWNEYDLKNENKKLKEKIEWLKHQVNLLKNKEEE